MYETKNERPMSESCKEPDWEAEAARANKELHVIEKFKQSLIEFIEVVGTHSVQRRGNGGSIQELLGTVVIDILQRKKQYERLLKKIEEKEK